MSKTQKIVLVLLVLAAGIWFYFYSSSSRKDSAKSPTNFIECSETAEGFIIKTLPAQCEFQGQNFVEQSQGQTTSPASTLPKFVFQENGSGCANIFVHKINADDTLGISVSAQEEKLGLSTQEKIFEVGKTDGLNVEILVGQHVSSFYCNDAANPDFLKPKKLIAKSGSARIKISNIDKSLPVWIRNYKATVTLKDVHFFDEFGNDVGTVDDLTFKDITVGMLPG